ncbi:hypothetical protein [Streptomyces albidochromogenes]|uniref:DUF3311 domain-containing protein n=1 Tax=Streptomyces albidochromogenes TaxID=329524 RepID=A0ABW6FJW7_9ACTN
MTRTGWHTATSVTGAALCWALGLAMVTSNVQAFFHPTWLSAIWYGPWVLTGALFVAWAACRALDKATTETEAPHPSPSRDSTEIDVGEAA